nr:rod shape-determining protein MreC [Feifania hominis]
MAVSAASGGRANFLEDAIGAVITPIQKGLTGINNFIADRLSFFGEYKTLKAENEALEARVRELEEDTRELAALQSENAFLKEFLDLKEQRPDFELTTAQVIARDPGNFFYSFTIDRGTLDDIKLNDAVITSDGLVGVVSEVGATYAKVTSIIEQSTPVGAVVSRTRDVAMLEGDISLRDEGLCKLSLLPSAGSAQAGDVVVTSGLGGIFPKGIVIGTVTEVRPEASDISYYAIIDPAVDFQNIRDVVVIRSYIDEVS